jgi:NitT/TauT family transport system permease protein
MSLSMTVDRAVTKGMSMSVTTSAHNDVSMEARRYAQNGAKAPASGHKFAHTSRLPTLERLTTIVPPLVVAIILGIGWYMSTAYGYVNTSLILPKPGDVFASLIDGLNSGLFLGSALVTIQESVLGFLLALILALPLGYALAKSRWIAGAVHPYLAAGQAIPAIVIAPLLMFWLGTGLVPIIIVCMLVVFFPMVVTTALGVQTMDKTLTDAARVEGAAGWSLLAFIEFPLALPAILAGIRTSLTLSITGALVGEFVGGGDQGLGALVQIAREQFNLPLLFATLLILGVLAAIYYGSTWLLVKLAETVY